MWRAARKTGVNSKMKKINFEKFNFILGKALPFAKKYRSVLIVLFAGVILLASGSGGAAKETAKSAQQLSETAVSSFNLTEFENSLSENLSAMEGVGRVSLMLSIEETEEAVYAVNVRQSKNGDSGQSYESNLTILSDGSYGEKPVTVKNMQPIFRGAIVLCDGAENAKVKLAVTNAVSTVCGIGTDKVAVLKMEELS